MVRRTGNATNHVIMAQELINDSHIKIKLFSNDDDIRISNASKASQEISLINFKLE